MRGFAVGSGSLSRLVVLGLLAATTGCDSGASSPDVVTAIDATSEDVTAELGAVADVTIDGEVERDVPALDRVGADAVEPMPDAAVDGGVSMPCGPMRRNCFGGACVDGVCQPVETLRATEFLNNLIVGGDYLYFSALTSAETEQEIRRVRVDGGAATLVHQCNSPPCMQTPLWATDSRVWWSETGLGPVPRYTSFGATAFPGAESSTLASGYVLDEAVGTPDGIVFSTYLPDPMLHDSLFGGPTLKVDYEARVRELFAGALSDRLTFPSYRPCFQADGDLYLTGDSEVFRRPAGGGAATAVAHTPEGVEPVPGFCAVADGRLYTYEQRDVPGAGNDIFVLRRAPLAGGEATVLGEFHEEESQVSALTAVGGEAFYATWDQRANRGAVYRVRSGGGAPELVAGPFTGRCSGIAADSRMIYWVIGVLGGPRGESSGSIYRVAR